MSDILSDLRAVANVNGDTYSSAEVIAMVRRAADEIERLKGGLTAAIRAANLAIFVINKQGVMPNDSWQDGFDRDLKTATNARGDTEQI
jgi:hypothetical protein